MKKSFKDTPIPPAHEGVYVCKKTPYFSIKVANSSKHSEPCLATLTTFLLYLLVVLLTYTL